MSKKPLPDSPAQTCVYKGWVYSIGLLSFSGPPSCLRPRHRPPSCSAPRLTALWVATSGRDERSAFGFGPLDFRPEWLQPVTLKDTPPPCLPTSSSASSHVRLRPRAMRFKRKGRLPQETAACLNPLMGLVSCRATKPEAPRPSASGRGLINEQVRHPTGTGDLLACLTLMLLNMSIVYNLYICLSTVYRTFFAAGKSANA